MLGIFNLTRDETLDGNEQKNENIDNCCYGGFSNRLNYEYSQNRRFTPSVALVYIAVFIFFGVTLGACGMIAYDFIEQNRLLYFPQTLSESEPVDTMSLTRSVVAMDDMSLVAVSYDQSVRYRIPRGVMIKGAVSEKYDGLMTGDIIVAVNDYEILDVESLEKHCNDAEKVVLRVFRQNRYIDISMEE